MKIITALLSCALLSTAIPSDAANIIWVSFHPGNDTPSTAAASAGFTRAPDAGYTDLLIGAGHTVTRVVSSDIPNAATLNAADLVIISRSVPSGHYELDAETAAWNGITAPTLILGGYIIRNIRLGYTSGGTIPDTTNSVTLKAQVPGHPIFAGISLDSKGKMANPYANVVSRGSTPILQRGISVNTDPIAVGGIVLGTIATPDPTLGGMIIGEWLAGDAMATSPVDTLGGHRLVLLTGSREENGAPTTEIAGIYDLTADGATIFLNAVNYMTSGRIAVKTVNTVNNDTPGASETSLKQALTTAQAGDTVRFKIPGAGPHMITTPLGGYPLITSSINIDGYTQPGSTRNTNPILSNNNAQIKIVLDSTGADTAPNPDNAARPLRRSTRLDFPLDSGNTGYGETENCVLGVVQADNVTIKGLSILGRRTPGTEDDPSIYGVALVRAAENARVQGSWFGLAPGAASSLANVKPVASAVAAFRWRIGGDVFSSGATVGTDGDGASDRGEFNIIVGGRISLAIEAPNFRASGNFVNLYPSGKDFLELDANYQLWRDAFEAAGEDPDDVTIENFENGRAADNTLIGTDGDGISDADERNVFGHVVYGHAGEVYSAGTNIVLAGNYYGVGIDGVSKAPASTNVEPDFIELPGNASIRIGSNGDGVNDALEGNVIHNISGTTFCVSGSGVPITARGNVMVNSHFAAMPFADGQNGRIYIGYYAPYVADATTKIPPVVQKFENNIISGSMAAPGTFNNAVIDVYVLDPASLANPQFWPSPSLLPGKWVGSFRDNGPGDLNPAQNEFSYDLTSIAPTISTYVGVTVTYSQDAGVTLAGRSVTTPMSNPIAPRSFINLRFLSPTQVELWWLGPQDGAFMQFNDYLELPDNWLEFFGESYSFGRSYIVVPYDGVTAGQFFRLKHR